MSESYLPKAAASLLASR